MEEIDPEVLKSVADQLMAGGMVELRGTDGGRAEDQPNIA